MKYKILFILCSLLIKIKAQDSIVKQNNMKHEVGISVLAPLIFLCDLRDPNERFSKISYRYKFKKKQAFKFYAGFSILNLTNSRYDQYQYILTDGTRIYPTSEVRTPTNIEIGLGYEIILGKRSLKHVFGLDFVYNNKFLVRKSYDLIEKDSIGANGQNFPKFTTSNYLESGTNYNKFGVNLNYGLRYEISKRWVATSSFTFSYRYYRLKLNGNYHSYSDIYTFGIISDISIFYRF